MAKVTEKHNRIGKRKALVENPLLIEGISRSGKFLLANLLHGFRGVEHVQYYGLLEHIPFLEKFGLIEKKTAREILQCEVDTHCYEMLIGRNFNYRKSDKSSIFNNPSYKKYLNRCKEPDGDLALEKYSKEKLCSMFIAHELMPNIKIYFDTFPKLKVISIQRSPIYLVYSWYNRGLGRRFGDDPKLFSISLRKNSENIPWFAADWGERYLSLTEMDRSIASIDWLTRTSKETYRGLSQKDKNKILYISYEGVLTHTDKVLRKIKNFLKRPIVVNSMKLILKREKLPNRQYSESKQEKLLLIKKKSSPYYFKKLLALETEYIKGEKTL
jgi:hypothetical protein